MRPPERCAAENGFTLIEVIVAFSVAALLMVIIMPAALDAGRREARARQQNEAVTLATSLIEERRAAPAELADREGSSRGLHWLTREAVVMNDPRGFFVLTRIEAQVKNADGKPIFSASTRKLRTAPSL